MPIVAQVRDVAHGPLVYICVILQLFVRFIYIYNIAGKLLPSIYFQICLSLQA